MVVHITVLWMAMACLISASCWAGVHGQTQPSISNATELSYSQFTCLPTCICTLLPQSTYASDMELQIRCNKQLPGRKQPQSSKALTINTSNVVAIYISNSSQLQYTADSFCSVTNVISLQWVDSVLPPFSNQSFSCLTELQYLDLSNNDMTILGQTQSQDLPNLHTLILARNSIAVIEPVGFMSNLPTLSKLDISGNVLQVLPKDLINIFNLPSLSTLNASYNRLQRLENDLFGESQSNLQKLDLSHNQIEDIGSAFSFKAVNNVAYLDMSYNEIRRLLPAAFDGLQSVKILNLSANKIHSLMLGIFSPIFHNLTTLQLSYNQIDILPGGTFYGLQSLMYLNLSHNYIRSIDARSFSWDGSIEHNGTSSSYFNSPPVWEDLVTVDLSHNNISSMHTNTFTGALSNVRQLLLGFNQISYLPRYGIEHLRNLELIDLQHNTLEWLDVGTFNNVRLRVINLSNNHLIKLISMVFLYLPRIELIDLRHNHLNYVYKYAFYKSCSISRQLKIHMDHNQLESDIIYKLFSTFKHLPMDNCNITLTLQDNHIKHVLTDVPDNYQRQLKRLDYAYFEAWDYIWFDISQNPIECDCRLFEELRIIKAVQSTFFYNFSNPSNLDFWQSAVCHKPKHMEHHNLDKATQKLNCTHIKNCPLACNCTHNPENHMMSVDCINRGLKEMPFIFPHGPKFILMSGNKILKIPDNINLSGVLSLDLSQNQINVIDHLALKRILKVPSVFLHSNKLTMLPQSIESFHGIRTLRITLWNNPFMCTCNDLWFKYWLLNNSAIIDGVNNITCGMGWTGAPSLIGSHDIDFRCVHVTNPGVIRISAFCLFLISLLISGFVIGVFVYRYRLRLNAYMLYRWRWRQLRRDILHSRYDLFIAHCQDDTLWVTSELVPRLLSHNMPYTVCVQNKTCESKTTMEADDTVIQQIEHSDSIIIVLSPEFVNNDWALVDYRDPILNMMRKHSDKVYVLILREVDLSNMEQEFAYFIKNNLCLKTTNEWFWERLFYMLPQPRSALLQGRITCDEEEHLQQHGSSYIVERY